jgi:arylsulfatase A-like enzyme
VLASKVVQPLGRGFDRFYGFLDAETDQYAPELVADNTHIDPPGSYADGYHLTSDLSIRRSASSPITPPIGPICRGRPSCAVS